MAAEASIGLRALALGYGVLCHGGFAAAVGLMVFGLWSGMQTGHGPFQGTTAWVVNLLLLAQFPLLHSLLLTRRGRPWLARMAPRGHARTLAPTLYAISASAQIALVFALWSPSGVVWWQPQGVMLWLQAALFAASWAFLVKALHDGHLPLQSGSAGWTALWRGDRPDYGPLPTRGLFARCRQPIYLGFALTLWTGPVWTPDRLLLAIPWTVYCALGPLHKERRFAALHGEAFASYRARVPYMIPGLSRTRNRAV